MAKGQEAKDLVINKIKQVFGNDYIGEFNKKFYVWSSEDGAPMQVCIALTCPKTPIGIDTSNNSLDFSGSAASPEVHEAVTAEITQEERDNLEALMNKLGL